MAKNANFAYHICVNNSGKAVAFPKKQNKNNRMNTAKRLFHLLAILALCMQLTAHLSPVLAEINGNWQITICSGDSFKTITIDKNGEETPAAPNMRMHDCAFCAAANFTAAPPVQVCAPVTIFTPAEILQPEEQRPAIYKHGIAHATRAPPALS